MSMNMHAIGFKPADEKWRKMKTVWEACEEAGVKIPLNVLEYFDDEFPGDKPGMEVALGESCKEWNGDCSTGFEVDLENLPEGVKFIRIYNSY